MKISTPTEKGFVLATMLVMSTVMLVIGVTILQTIVSIVGTYNDTYQNAVATQAAEAGVVYANTCVTRSEYQQTWGTLNSKPPLKPNSDCNGTIVSGQRQYVVDQANKIQSYFVVDDLTARTDGALIIKSTGYAQLLDKAGNPIGDPKIIVVNQSVSWPSDYAGSASSSGWKRTCGIISGNAYCWGEDNQYGQLGNGTTTSSPTPVKVLKESTLLLGQTISQISSGLYHNCVLSSGPNGKVYCWGNNQYGQLGNGNKNNSDRPVLVAGALAGKTITAISTSSYSSCAIADGNVYCWGRNNAGQLGIGNNTAEPSTPTQVSTGVIPSGQATKLSTSGAGAENTCAIANGDAYCWGNGDYGQLGVGARSSTPTAVPNNNPYFSTSPVAVLKETGALAGKTVTAISTDAAWTNGQTAYGHVCAIASGKAYCWGSNRWGQVGHNPSPSSNYAIRPSAVETTVMSAPVTEIAVGALHTCAISNSKVYCWGGNGYGQLGNGSYGSANASTTPVAVAEQEGVFLKNGVSQTVSGLGGGFNRGCGVANAKTYCWGNNSDGQIGDGTSGNIDSADTIKPYPTESTFLRSKAPVFLF